MALSEARIKARILLMVGDVDLVGNPCASGGIVENNLDLVWDTYSAFSGKLRELFCRRDLIKAVISRLALTADTAIGRDLGLSVKKSDRAKAYQQMLEDVLLEIKNTPLVPANGVLTANRIGQLHTTQPVADEDRAEFVSEIL